MGQHDIACSKSLVQLDGLADSVWREGLRRVVSGVAPNAESVEFLADLFGKVKGPIIIGCIELDALIPQLRHAPHRSDYIVFQVVTNGVEFESDGDVFPGGQGCP